MQQLNLILDMWQKDCKIEPQHLDKSSAQTPILHAKYIQLLAEAKQQHKRAEFAQKNLLKDKWLYYNGKMTDDEIKARGWSFDPFNGLKIMKGEMDYYYDSDTDIQKSIETIHNWKTVIDTLSEIIDNLKWRHQTIGNMIKWRQFESGG